MLYFCLMEPNYTNNTTRRKTHLVLDGGVDDRVGLDPERGDAQIFDRKSLIDVDLDDEIINDLRKTNKFLNPATFFLSRATRSLSIVFKCVIGGLSFIFVCNRLTMECLMNEDLW